MNQGALVATPSDLSLYYVGAKGNDLDVILNIFGERRSASARITSNLCEAIDRAVRHIVPHGASFHGHEISQDGALIIVAVHYIWEGQLIACNASDEDEARAAVLAVLAVVRQVVCRGPTH